MSKNLQTMYKAVQNWSSPFLSTCAFSQISLNILNQLLKLNNDFKYFMHEGKLLKLRVERVAALAHTHINFNFKL